MRTTDRARRRAPLGALLPLLIVAACMPGNGMQKASRDPGPVHARIAASILYSQDLPDESGQLLRRRDLSTGASTTVIRLAANQTALPLGRDAEGLIQVVTDRGSEISMGHFQADPHLSVHDPDGRPLAEMGRGGSASLHPDGQRIAWAEPLDVRTCEEDGTHPCRVPAARIVVAPLDRPDERTDLATLDDVNRLWWLDRERLVVERMQNRSVVVWADGRVEPGPEGRIRDVASEAGLVLLADAGLHSLRLGPPHPDPGPGPAWERGFGPRRADATVTGDGSRTLVQTVEPRADHTASTSLLLLDADGTERPIAQSRSDGNLLWSQDHSAFSYRRLSDDGSGFELIVCRADPVGCQIVWSWREGIEGLALTMKEAVP